MNSIARGQLDHEARTSAGPILDPEATVMEPDLLGGEREAEPDPTRSIPRCGTAREPFEHLLSKVGRDARAGVLNGDVHARAGCCLNRDPHQSAAVPLGVVHQVGDGPLEAPPVDADDEIGCRRLGIEQVPGGRGE
jgi:hypothetical protein